MVWEKSYRISCESEEDPAVFTNAEPSHVVLVWRSSCKSAKLQSYYSCWYVIRYGVSALRWKLSCANWQYIYVVTFATFRCKIASLQIWNRVLLNGTIRFMQNFDIGLFWKRLLWVRPTFRKNSFINRSFECT